MRPRSWFTGLQRIALVTTLISGTLPLPAAEIQLKNNMILRGTATPIMDLNTGKQQRVNDKVVIQTFPIVMVTDDLRRYFVADGQILKVDRERDPTLKGQEYFQLEHKRSGSQAVNTLGSVLEVTPWDEHGRRRIVLKGTSKNLPVMQGITLLTPEFVKLEALNYQWETALPITSIPREALSAILHKKIEPDINNPDKHLAIVRFYIQAGFYREARQELDGIGSRFKDLAKRVEEVRTSLAQAEGRQLLDELKLRQNAGQYLLAREAFQRFPRDRADTPLLKEVEANLKIYDAIREAGELTAARLASLQEEMKAKELEGEVGRCRAEILEKLNPQNLGRMEPFLRLGGVKSLSPDDRLGLALSGWIVGGADADSNLPLALRLWQARFLIQQYLRMENPNDRAARLAELERLEGISPARVAQILKNLQPIVDDQVIEPVKATRVQVTGPGRTPDVHYTVSLPTEYHPDHSYPIIIALTERGATPERELSFWAGTDAQPGQSARHGYIVIAPDYMQDNGAYDYNPVRHQIVFEALRDACRRFNVDCDRVYLSGHGRGGDAALDIGLSHPDLFAGVIPFSGVTDNGHKESKSRFYWQNALKLPIYAISGELDRETFERNTREFNRMLGHDYNVMLAEYRGYGRDSFFAEIHNLFGWMSVHRRNKLPTEISNYTMRPTDNRFYWLELGGLGSHTRSANVKARVLPGANTIDVSARASSVTLWLTPELIKLGAKLEVRVNGNVKWNKPVKGDLKAMLEDYRQRGDRQNIYWAVLSL